MRTRELIIVEPGRIELQERELDERLGPKEALLATEHSIISAGTEGAAFTGLVLEMPSGGNVRYPLSTGYGHLGRVLAVGSAVTACRPGDRVLTFSRHASVVKANTERMALPVPPDAPGPRLVFTRMAGVSITALRSSTVQPGDTVVVIGAGLVGNFAAQLFELAGAEVMVADVAEMRLEKARACGVRRAASAVGDALERAVDEWTGGQGAQVVVEAIGNSEVIDRAVRLTRRYGEVILLGSPRARATFDVTPMLSRIHLEAIRVIGSLEWRWPMQATDRGRDIQQNYRLLAGWIAAGRLAVDPLLTHLVSPADCQSVFEMVTQRKEDSLGVVFDWSRVGQ